MTFCMSAVSGKGGAGKTTAVILLAGEYALQGQRVLLIDADGRQNLQEWWKRCEAKDNIPDGIEIVSAIRQDVLQRTIDHAMDEFDVIIMDSPGQDTVARDVIIKHSDVVLTPIQPNQDEIRAAGEAAQIIGDVSDSIERIIPQANFKTRISLQSRSLEAYRLIRPFVQQLVDLGFDSHLLETELAERNCYREIRNGYGTLQMLEMTDPVRKARLEIQKLKTEIEALVASVQKAA